jgi:methyl-accepting chemotaxis protein
MFVTDSSMAGNFPMTNKRLLRGLTLKQRVFGFMTILGLIPLACLLLMVFQDRDSRLADEMSSVAAKGALRLSQMNAEIYAVVMDSRGLLLATSPKEIEEFAKTTEGHLSALKKIAETWKSESLPEDAKNLEAVSRDIDNLMVIRKKAIDVARKGDLTASGEISRSEESVRSRKALNASVEQLSHIYEAKEAKANSQREELREESLRFMYVVAALTLLLGGSGAMIVHRSVIRLFKRMSLVMSNVAAGNLDADFEGSERADEIGEFARALALFKDNAMERERLAAESAAARAQRDAEREEARKADELRAQEISDTISKLGIALSHLSRGDLTYRLDQNFTADFKRLQDDFNAAVSTLHETMSHITVNSGGIETGSAEITSASDDLSRRTEQQAASLEETVAALANIAQAVSRTSVSAANALASAICSVNSFTRSVVVSTSIVSSLRNSRNV